MGNDDTVENTREALQITNLSSAMFPWGGAANGLLKRWELPIPVKTNNDPRAIAALAEIERQLDMKIFEQMDAGMQDDQITRGLIVSVGTAYVKPDTDPRNACGGVAKAPMEGDWPHPAATAGGIMSYRLYVSIDGPECIASQDVVLHEFGHALGMGAHFNGFNDSGKSISPLFWRVLRTIYANKPGTSAASINVPELLPNI